MQFNPAQERAIKEAEYGHNIFITGGGGVGKSVVIRELQNRFAETAVFCSPTGIAALNINGATLHRTFGLPFGVATQDDFDFIQSSVGLLFATDTIKTIVIDEISMVRADMFTAIDKKLRKIKRINRPFGGLQVIVVGDFYQLPPVLTRRDEEIYYDNYVSIFAFDCDTWDECQFRVVELSQVMRQDDEITIRALNSIREGWQHENVIKWINRQCGNSDNVTDEAITLCTTNASAQTTNEECYRGVSGTEHVFYGETKGTFNDSEKPVEETLKLKVGCRVVICANNPDGGYINGQTGTVSSFEEDYIGVDLDCGTVVMVKKHKWNTFTYKVRDGVLTKDETGSFEQYPLKLGYAITIHKSQGMTLDECCLDLGKGAFAHGQTYVALSRIRSLDTLYLIRPLRATDILVDDDVIDFYDSLKE